MTTLQKANEAISKIPCTPETDRIEIPVYDSGDYELYGGGKWIMFTYQPKKWTDGNRIWYEWELITKKEQ